MTDTCGPTFGKPLAYYDPDGRHDGPSAGPRGAGRVRGEKPRQVERSGRRDRVDWGPFTDAIGRHAAVIGRDAPAPTTTKRQLNPVFVEWMMMLPEGWVTDVLTKRTAALKCLGNGVVPPQAEHAIRFLVGA